MYTYFGSKYRMWDCLSLFIYLFILFFYFYFFILFFYFFFFFAFLNYGIVCQSLTVSINQLVYFSLHKVSQWKIFFFKIIFTSYGFNEYQHVEKLVKLSQFVFKNIGYNPTRF